jgi:hypothetical protein
MALVQLSMTQENEDHMEGEKILRREESFPRDLFYLSSETMKRAFSLRIQVLPGSPIETRDKDEYSRVVSMIWFESSMEDYREVSAVNMPLIYRTTT